MARLARIAVLLLAAATWAQAKEVKLLNVSYDPTR
jgi:ABC-type sulfate transport system substrate-binding protein